MLDPHREWVQGIIQIAVAYHHLERENVKGALKLFSRGLARIKKFPLITYPLELGPFEASVKSALDQLTGLGEPVSGQIKVQIPKIEHK
jgi:predicted metal-dependent hydrolase